MFYFLIYILSLSNYCCKFVLQLKYFSIAKTSRKVSSFMEGYLFQLIFIDLNDKSNKVFDTAAIAE